MTIKGIRKGTERPHFTFFKSYFEAIEQLSNDSDKLKVFNAIAKYSLFGECEDLEGIPKLVFGLVKPTINNGWSKYSNGKTPKAKQKQNKSKTEAKEKLTPLEDCIVLDSIGKEGKGKDSSSNKKNTIKKEMSERELLAKENFEKARQLYPGKKRGLETEFANMKKRHKSWIQDCDDILTACEFMDSYNTGYFKTGYAPHFQTFITQRRWEEVLEEKKFSDKVGF